VAHAFILGTLPKFDILKCKLLHFGPCHQYGSYFLSSISQTSLHHDLGILFDDKLKFYVHTFTVSNRVLQLINLLNFWSLEILFKLYKALICPILTMYGDLTTFKSIYCYELLLHSRSIENVQQRATPVHTPYSLN